MTARTKFIEGDLDIYKGHAGPVTEFRYASCEDRMREIERKHESLQLGETSCGAGRGSDASIVK